MCIGTVFIWFGWFAFNGGSTANLSLRSIYVVVNTNMAACGGGIGWTLLDYLHNGKFSLVGFCSGIIAGLVGITPAAGFGKYPSIHLLRHKSWLTPGFTVMVYVSPLIGLLTSIVCFYAVKYKHILSVDDGLDIFAIHGIGGYVGDILTGIFAAQYVPALDGVSGASYEGGWWNRNFRQVGLQLAGATTCAAWSFVISCLLLFIINKIPGMHLRASEENEMRGLDYCYLYDVEMDGTIIMTEGLSNGSTLENTSGSVRESKKD